MGVSPAMLFKYGCHNHLRSVVLAGPRLAPLRMRGSLPMTLSGGCDMHVCLFHGCAWLAIFGLACVLRGTIHSGYLFRTRCDLSNLRPVLPQLCRWDRCRVSTLWLCCLLHTGFPGGFFRTWPVRLK